MVSLLKQMFSKQKADFPHVVVITQSIYSKLYLYFNVTKYNFRNATIDILT